MSLVGQMQMLAEHENGPEPDGDEKCSCGRFWMGMNDCCGHCFWEKADGLKCPVCQSPEIPQVFYDADMKGELRRLIAARKRWFKQHSEQGKTAGR